MHTNSRFYQTDSNIFKNPDNIIPKEYAQKLFKLGKEKCVEFLGEDIKNDIEKYKTCRLNVMTAIDCVARGKASNQLGDLRDNVGNCKHLISIVENNLKSSIPDFPMQKLNDNLREISLSTKSLI